MKAGSLNVVIFLAGSSHSIRQLGNLFCRAATEAGVTLVPLTFSVARVLQSTNGDRSDICVPPNHSVVSGIPFSGERSETFVEPQFRPHRFIPCSGEMSDNIDLPFTPPLHSRTPNPTNARTGEIS